MATIVILAAGKGSRYGKGIKQFAQVGPQGETIMELSVRDAKAAGFDEVIFILNKDILQEFKATIYKRLPKDIRYRIILQEMPYYRTKPMGTVQAVMLCRDIITEPFAVINADDYYGAEAYHKAYTFLSNNTDAYGMIGYRLVNTLWSSGEVTRGICEIDNAGRLLRIRETKGIKRDDKDQKYNGREIVSVNFWLLPPSFFDMATDNIKQYIWEEFKPERDEVLLPDVIDSMIRHEKINVNILTDNSYCLGITYEKDTQTIRNLLK